MKNVKNKINIGNLLVLLTVVIFIIIISFVIYNKTNNNETSIKSCLEIVMDDKTLENGITLTNKNIAKSSEVADLGTYNFKVTNKCNNYVEYNLNIESLYSNPSTNEYIDSKYVNVSIDNIKSNLSSLDNAELLLDKGTSYESYNLLSASLNPKQSKKYKLKLWISDDYQDSNKKYIGKVVVYGQVKKVNFATYLMNSYDNEVVYEESELNKSDNAYTINMDKSMACYANNFIVEEDMFILSGDIKCSDYREELLNDGYIYTIKKTNRYALSKELYEVTSIKKEKINLIKYDVFKEANFKKVNDNTEGLIKFNNNYYFSGSSANNFVKIDNDDNLYQVLGIYDIDGIYLVKLINYDPLNKKYYFLGGTKSGIDKVCGTNNESNCSRPLNNYEQSYINTIINESKKDYVVEAPYNIGSSIYMLNVVNAQQLENKKQLNLSYGLMTMTDYIFTTSVDNWHYNIKSNDLSNTWLNISDKEFTITANMQYDDEVFYSNNMGIESISIIEDEKLNIRPAFFIRDDILLDSGLGTKEKPYILKLK